MPDARYTINKPKRPLSGIPFMHPASYFLFLTIFFKHRDHIFTQLLHNAVIIQIPRMERLAEGDSDLRQPGKSHSGCKHFIRPRDRDRDHWDVQFLCNDADTLLKFLDASVAGTAAFGEHAKDIAPPEHMRGHLHCTMEPCIHVDRDDVNKLCDSRANDTSKILGGAEKKGLRYDLPGNSRNNSRGIGKTQVVRGNDVRSLCRQVLRASHRKLPVYSEREVKHLLEEVQCRIPKKSAL